MNGNYSKFPYFQQYIHVALRDPSELLRGPLLFRGALFALSSASYAKDLPGLYHERRAPAGFSLMIEAIVE